MSKHTRDSDEQQRYHSGLRSSGLAPSAMYAPQHQHHQQQISMPASYYAATVPAAASSSSSSALSMPQPQLPPPQQQQQQQQASYEAYGTSPTLPIPSVHHRPSSGAWTPQDDQQLVSARMQGLNWAQIREAYFPSKTPNACRKRHERLMERKGADDWDTIKMQRLAKEYMSMRKEIWSGLAARTGEKWNVVEAKCMSNGLKNLQSAARAASRRDRLETGASLTGYDDDSGISGIGLTPVDELDASYSSPETNSSSSSSYHHLQLQPHHNHHHGGHQHHQGSYAAIGGAAAAYYGAGHAYSSSSGSSSASMSHGYVHHRAGQESSGSSPYMDAQRLANRPGGGRI